MTAINETAARPQRRAGTFTLGVALVVAGLGMMASLFWPALEIGWLLKLSPLILVCLGVEVLLAARGGGRVKYDWLGMLYLNLNGNYEIEPDLEEASKWFRLRAEAPDSTDDYAMGGLGQCYLYSGNAENYPLAVEWFERAAALNNSSAMYDLYRCYANGWGVEANEEIAREWLERAAEAGYAAAQEILAQE